MTALWMAVGALAILAILEALAILALAREVGLLSRRLPPAPALESLEGTEPGAALPALRLADARSGRHSSPDLQSRPAMVLFLSTRCTLCAGLLSELDGVVKDWPDHAIVPVLSGPAEEARAMLERSGFAGQAWQDDGPAMRAVGIVTTPRALLVDTAGVVRSRGVVNNREMVSSLIQGRVRTGEGAVWVEGDSVSSAS